MDVVEADHVSDGGTTDGDGAVKAPRAHAVEQGGILRVYARDNDTRIKLISDETPVPDAERLVDIAFFSSPQDADAVAAWCADLLATAKMKADIAGWHSLPVRNLPVLLNAARTHFQVTYAPVEDVTRLLPQREEGRLVVVDINTSAPQTPASDVTVRRAWTRERVARLGFLAGQGWTAKQIALDPLVMSTPNNVQRQANRFGILLSDGPQGQVTFNLPIATTAVIDRAAAAVSQTRKAFLRQWLIRGASDPGRYGMVVISI